MIAAETGPNLDFRQKGAGFCFFKMGSLLQLRMTHFCRTLSLSNLNNGVFQLCGFIFFYNDFPILFRGASGESHLGTGAQAEIHLYRCYFCPLTKRFFKDKLFGFAPLIGPIHIFMDDSADIDSRI
ncbi:hypothetical protein [Bacillus marinisedimentorum]|uniref:hypothetical protein n=1 Tax=Bacillus marinisedimentorum TaxID=1821260 RepID=UPI0007E046EC|nr:hypothetical protein [Bacillus marinisedimentorum]